MSNDKGQNPVINTKALQNWLFLSAFMVFAMAIVGAVTRLTESGLSMVEWRPLIGMIPPLTDANWEHVFALYQDTPEFEKKNAWMTLADFKEIFFWEWLHRFWGRLIGLVYALPLLYFWVRGQIPQGYKFKLLIGLLLGGAQGLMGWYMVKSGLVDRPSVSHYRLAAHLSLAFLIFGYLLWLALDLRGHRAKETSFCLKRHGWIAMGCVIITVIWGAFVAGLDGGMLYNTWPMMNGHLVPPEVSGAASLLTDPAGVQFSHRWIAVLSALVVLSFARRMKSEALAVAVLTQVALGLGTLLTQVSLPLAALHQAGALIVFAVMVYLLQGLHARRA